MCCCPIVLRKKKRRDSVSWQRKQQQRLENCKGCFTSYAPMLHSLEEVPSAFVFFGQSKGLVLLVLFG